MKIIFYFILKLIKSYLKNTNIKDRDKNSDEVDVQILMNVLRNSIRF